MTPLEPARYGEVLLPPNLGPETVIGYLAKREYVEPETASSYATPKRFPLL